MYTINYDPSTGKPTSIQHGRDTIMISEDNMDFRDFLAWNEKQAAPLDWQTPVAPTVFYSISPSREIIRGNGVHTAKLSIQADGVSVDMLVNGAMQTVMLVNGKGILEIASDTPGAEIVITGASGGLAMCSAIVYVV